MIKIDIDTKDFEEKLTRLLEFNQNMKPTMLEISEALVGISQEAFAREKDPTTGKIWNPLSPITIGRRKKDGHDGGILQVHGQLAGNIVSDSGSDYATVGTNTIYGSTHQFGAKKGAFGKTRRGGPIPWGDIPARPFLGLGLEGKEELHDILRRRVQMALSGR